MDGASSFPPHNVLRTMATVATPSPHTAATGIVKQVLSGDAVVIRGTPKRGPPPERILALSNIVAPRLARRPGQQPQQQQDSKDEPYAWESREHLRRLLVGQDVKFTVEHKVPSSGREYGTVWVRVAGEVKCANEEQVAAGWAEVRSGGKSEEHSKLSELQVVAKASNKGKWQAAGEGSKPVRDVTWNVENLQQFVDKSHGKEIDAVVEHVRDGSTIRAILLPSFTYLTLMLCGVKCPGFKREGDRDITEPFAEEARFFSEARLLQRDVKVRLEGVSSQNAVGTVLHPNGNIAERLLKEGLARCVDWSIRLLSDGREVLRVAEKEAKEKRLRIWKEYKPTEVVMPLGQKEFVARVVEVVNADALVVRMPSSGKHQKIFFSSLRPPRLENKPEEGEGQPQQSSGRSRPLYEVPYLFEAREFLRKRLIGRKVNVAVDYVKPAQDGFPERIFCTVTRESINMAEALISKGYGKALRHRQDDDLRSSCYDELLSAEARAEKNRKGLFNKKEYTPIKVADFSGDPAKAKHFLPFLQRAGKTTALVEFVASGSRFRLYLPKDTCLVNFLLAGVSCPRAGQTSRSGETVPGEPWGDEGLTFSKELILQREVDVEVESVDRGGNFIGWLYVEGRNLTQLLVEEGLGKVHASADRSPHARSLYEAEQLAKEARKRVWEGFQEEAKGEQNGEGEEEEEKEEDVPATTEEEESERTTNYQNVLVVGLIDPVTFWGQLEDQGPKLQQLMSSLQSDFAASPPTVGAFKPKRDELCAAKYSDGQWYRAVAEQIGPSQEVSVLYVDYGNRESLSVARLAALPQDYRAPAYFAKEYKLAHVAPTDDDDWRQDLMQSLRQQTEGVCQLNVEYVTQNQEFVSLLSSAGTDIAEALVREGLLQVQPRRDHRKSKLVVAYTSAQDSARKERLNIWRYGDFRED